MQQSDLAGPQEPAEQKPAEPDEQDPAGQNDEPTAGTSGAGRQDATPTTQTLEIQEGAEPAAGEPVTDTAAGKAAAGEPATAEAAPEPVLVMAATEKAPAEKAPAEKAPAEKAPAEQAEPGRVRRTLRKVTLSRILTLLAIGIVVGALLWPNILSRLGAGSFVRIPIEAAVLLGVAIALPRRPRRITAVVLGLLLGWLVVEKCLDMGFFQFLARPFDPVLDWVLFDDAYDYVHESYGVTGVVGALTGIVLILLIAFGLITWAMLRVAEVASRHRRGSAFTAGGVAIAWAMALVFGVQLAGTLPLAARTTYTYAVDRAWQAKAGLANEKAFAQEVKQDAFQNVPSDQLLTGLKGKDVMLTFVESYGRSALELPTLEQGIGAVLKDGDSKLTQAGFGVRSGWLTSPTYGGGSWLAHSTTMSGLWINNQSRYRNLTASTRLTLPYLFREAGWDTVSVMPGATRAWPEGNFYGFNRIWDSRNLGYTGPKFSWAPMPDQYTLKAFTENEYQKTGRGNLFVEMPLVSSHTPWAPIPEFMDWDQVGDGSVYNKIVADQPTKAEIWTNGSQVRREYGKSIQYTLTTLIDWITTYGDDNLVMVFLGDHQASPVVSGEGASHDVPITIVAKDPKVLERIDSWGWTESTRPSATAPEWPMNAFRDKFLTAFGPGGTDH
ncbi:sulfatase-like hydrolase/transferase [Actinoplanes sp. NPDC051851]|uniref:sulfatase-like hydrolase/transferase n=1 Tax=Actinoplanes sp. NPDC051851 TaxID=3154753 RepID=UPI00344823EB